MPVIDKLDINGGLLFKETVGSDSRQGICNEVTKRTVSGVFNLCNVLQFIIDRFNQCSFSEQDFIGYTHQRVPHIVLNFSDKLYTVKEKVFKQSLTGISFVGTEFPLNVSQELTLFQRLPITYIPRGKYEIKDFAFVIDNQMQLESEERFHGTFPTLGKSFESFVNQYPLVTADTQGSGVDKADAVQVPNRIFLAKIICIQ